MNTPDFIVIGEVKCATTSFYNYLVEHPQILSSYGNGIDVVDDSYSKKEVRFFDRYYEKGFDWYRSCFPSTSSGEVTGEATPMYMCRTTAAYRIKAHLPDVKLIVQLRNPVDRLYSNFMHYYRWFPGWSDRYPTFEKYIYSTSDLDNTLIERGVYFASLEKWLVLFKREQFHFITVEDLHSSPQETYSEALKFLGVDPYLVSEFKHFRKLESKPMSAKERAFLVDLYRPYNKKLNELLGIDFGWDY